MRSKTSPRQRILAASAGALIVVACATPGSRAPTTEVSVPGATGFAKRPARPGLTRPALCRYQATASDG